MQPPLKNTLKSEEHNPQLICGSFLMHQNQVWVDKENGLC